MRFMAGNGSEVISVTAHGRCSLRLAWVGVLEHALRLIALACWSTPYACFDDGFPVNLA